MLREKSLRALKVVAVTFEARFLQAIRHLLALDDPQRGIGTRLPAPGQVTNPIADFIEHRPFVESLPGRDQADGGDPILVGLFGRFQHRLRVDKPVLRGTGLVVGRLGAEAAILGAAASLGVHNGAQVNFVAFEMFADAVGPGE